VGEFGDRWNMGTVNIVYNSVLVSIKVIRKLYNNNIKIDINETV